MYGQNSTRARDPHPRCAEHTTALEVSPAVATRAGRALGPEAHAGSAGTLSAKRKPIQKQVVHAAIDALFQFGVSEDG